MSDTSACKRIFAWIDELNHSVRLMASHVEKHLTESGYSVPQQAGAQVFWGLSPDLDKGSYWRVPMVTRVLGHFVDGMADHSLIYQVMLNTDSSFDFPSMLCVRAEHGPLSMGEVYRRVWQSSNLAGLHRDHGPWRSFRQERGWCYARPSYSSAIREVKGYILDLLDLDSTVKVEESVVAPLLMSGSTNGLRLGVPAYHFPGLVQAGADTAVPYAPLA